jgi:hypothetical protein
MGDPPPIDAYSFRDAPFRAKAMDAAIALRRI